MSRLSNPDTGLSSAEAAKRLQAAGPNELASGQPRSLLALAWGVVCEPMFVLLAACGGIYLLLGSVADATILLAFVFIIMALSLAQERKSTRALEALRDLSSPRALVLRDGRSRRIAGREVVPGDIIFLAEGDRVPADAILFAGQGLSVDESLLTGESAPVAKLPGDADQPLALPGTADPASLYAGALVVQGKGRAQVCATGAATALGRIGQDLASQPAPISRVQQQTAHAVKLVAWSSAALALLLTLWFGLSRGDWLNAVLAGLTMSMALLPAELPLILTIFLALGAWRIARQRVLTRQLSAIDMLGAATVLCVDKTGTLTQNRMMLSHIMVGDALHHFDGASPPTPDGIEETFHATLEYAMLSSQRDPFDPMEQAIQQTGQAALAGTEHLHGGWTLVEEYPLSPALLAMSRVWRSPDSAHYMIAAKGAAEAIVDLCHLAPAEQAAITARVNQLASQGLRVLAVASATFGGAALPPIQHDFEFRFLGLIGLADPLRPTAAPAIAECHAAGIRVVMITGDYPATALSIARQSGLDADGGLLTGAELDQMDDAALAQRLASVRIFCRVRPEQKLRLVNVLKQSGEIVAMTGDGVNDAPALKAAHIGIAMGERGTDVAREAAALVLLDDDFGAVVAAVRLGRRIVDNIRKAVVFIVAAHLPIAGMSLLPVMLGWPLLLLPIHIVFFELMIDPTCSVVFEAEQEEPGLMQRPPRRPEASLFEPSLLWLGVRQGMLLFGLMVAAFVLSGWAGLAAESARALTFCTMIVGDIWLILMNRSARLSLRTTLGLGNRALWAVVAAALLTLALALYLPALRELFHFGPVPLPVLGVAMGALVLALALATALGRARLRM